MLTNSLISGAIGGAFAYFLFWIMHRNWIPDPRRICQHCHKPIHKSERWHKVKGKPVHRNCEQAQTVDVLDKLLEVVPEA